MTAEGYRSFPHIATGALTLPGGFEKLTRMLENLADSFKPEERNRGEDLFRKGAVFISSASDTGVRATVKAPGQNRVSLAAPEVGSSGFSMDCSCTLARKGKPCKHVWAVLLALEEKGSDFLEGKGEVEAAPTAAQASEAQPQNARAEEAKARQSEYRKQQYEKQKTRAKAMRRERKNADLGADDIPEFPTAVAEARAYFLQNGFDLKSPLNVEDLASARKILSRVFHPDKGGTHAETLELNRQFDVIHAFIERGGLNR